MPGALFQGEKLPGYRPGLAHVQPFVTTKTTRRNSATRPGPPEWSAISAFSVLQV